MKFSISGVAAVWALVLSILACAEMIPVEHFAKSPLFSKLRMSPDGEYVAFLHEEEGRTLLYLSDVALKQRTARVDPGLAAGSAVRKEISDYGWITDTRLAFTTTVWDLYPVFIIQGKDDRVVPQKQAKLMITALEKAGHKPEKLFLSDTGHGFTSEKGRIEGYKRIEVFLHKHLGPGVTPVMPVAVVSRADQRK